ncbi:MAG: dehydrogenase [Burkholderiaceae bacterium]|nr:dehydrogenase [Burkholderiaceae bacterium]
MGSGEARAYWIVSPRCSEIRAEALPAPAAGEVLVRALYSGISRGSETLVFRGEVPAGERHRMRAPFQAGEFPGPVKYGYCSVGVIERGPAELAGATVFCLHPHQDRYVVPVAAVHRVPQSVPAQRAVLAANLETAINAVWDAGLQVGDRVAVVGGGVVGLLLAWLAVRVPGCRVELIDIDASRAAVAAALGVTFVAPEHASADADRVFHASGSSEGLALALALAGDEAKVIELSWYGTRAVRVPLGEAFHSRRLALCSSQVGAVAGPQRARWSHRRRMALALALLDDARLDALVTEESAFDALPALMARLADGTQRALCHRVAYR